jgi:hypothetical protein
MSVTSPSTTIVPTRPDEGMLERLALVGLLAGYSGPTRDSYRTDLRLFTVWLIERQVRPSPLDGRAEALQHRPQRAHGTGEICTPSPSPAACSSRRNLVHVEKPIMRGGRDPETRKRRPTRRYLLLRVTIERGEETWPPM